MKTITFAAAGALALGSVPVVAADQPRNPGVVAAEPDEGFAELGSLMGEMFGKTPEPLSPEAEARLPAAREVADYLFPAGTFTKVMDETLGGPFRGLTSLIKPSAASTVAKLTGLSESDFAAYDEAAIVEAATLLDPAYSQRGEMEMQAFTGWMADLMVQMEPLYRDGYAKAYAARFTAEQLADLKAFFETPSGAFYASQSILIGTDPQVTGKMQEVFPLMMASMPAMLEKTNGGVLGLPEERYFDSLNTAEQARIAELLGQNVEDLTELSIFARVAGETYEPLEEVPTPAVEID